MLKICHHSDAKGRRTHVTIRLCDCPHEVLWFYQYRKFTAPSRAAVIIIDRGSTVYGPAATKPASSTCRMGVYGRPSTPHLAVAERTTANMYGAASFKACRECRQPLRASRTTAWCGVWSCGVLADCDSAGRRREQCRVQSRQRPVDGRHDTTLDCTVSSRVNSGCFRSFGRSLSPSSFVHLSGPGLARRKERAKERHVQRGRTNEKLLLYE
ncbi:unnamed protein product [Calypogeia fissa]